MLVFGRRIFMPYHPKKIPVTVGYSKIDCKNGYCDPFSSLKFTGKHTKWVNLYFMSSIRNMKNIQTGTQCLFAQASQLCEFTYSISKL